MSIRLRRREFITGLGGDNNRMRALAQELVGLQPDVILANGLPAIVAVQQEMRTIPIVYVGATDLVATGIVAPISRAGTSLASPT